MYTIKYVVGCSPKLREVKTKLDVKKFLLDFIYTFGSLDDGEDNYIEAVFEGRSVPVKSFIKVKKDKAS